MDALLVLTNIAILLLLGSLCSLLARKLRESDVLVLLLLGIIIGKISYGSESLFAFDDSLLIAIGVLALIMIVFDTASRFRLKEKGVFARQAFKLTGLFALFCVLLSSLFLPLLFFGKITIVNILLSLVFSLVVVATDLDAVLVMLRDYVGSRAKKVLALLQTEAIISTGLVVVVPFIAIDLIKDLWLLEGTANYSLLSQLLLLLFQLIVGIGAGVVVGIVVLRALQKLYSHHVSSISLLAGVLVAYLLAENLGGNGALAVAALGFMFGSFYVKDKPKLQEFSYMLSNSLEILIFLLLGLVVKIPFTFVFIFSSLLLFLIVIVARMGAVFIAMKKNHSLKEKLFIGLNMPKGIAVAVIVFMLALYKYAPFEIILQLILAIMIYSLILSSVIDHFSKKFVTRR